MSKLTKEQKLWKDLQMPYGIMISCDNCKYLHLEISDHPCNQCDDGNGQSIFDSYGYGLGPNPKWEWNGKRD